MALVNIFHPVGAILLPEVLCDYIESKANVADLLELAYLLALGVAFLPTVPPPPEMWTTPLPSRKRRRSPFVPTTDRFANTSTLEPLLAVSTLGSRQEARRGARRNP